MTISDINQEIIQNRQNTIEEERKIKSQNSKELNKNVIQQIVDRDILIDAPHKLKIRLLCHQNIDCKFSSKKKKTTGCCVGNYNSSQKLTQSQKDHIQNKYKEHPLDQQLEVVEDSDSLNFEAILIHIHGGGFSAEGTKTHEIYTRIWANQLKIPIFALEYRKAPEFPYPNALDDVWQCYYWIINYADKFLRDSAGGNLVAALTLKIIKEGVRMPDGLLLIYPALRMVEDQFSPSILKAIDDTLLSLAGMKLILKAYVPQEAQPTDIFLSPILASDELLSEFPPVKMILGENDPIQDDCIRFAHRLMRLGKDIKAIVYKNVAHGFIQFSVPIKECELAITDAINLMSQLIQDKN